MLIVDVRGWLRVQRRAGMAGRRARDVAEGVEVAARLRPRAVLLDQLLPDGCGLDAGHRLRQELPEIHLILFSAHDLDTEKEAAALGLQTISEVDRTARFATIGADRRALTGAVTPG